VIPTCNWRVLFVHPWWTSVCWHTQTHSNKF
jgi:hypothetical protein